MKFCKFFSNCSAVRSKPQMIRCWAVLLTGTHEICLHCLLETYFHKIQRSYFRFHYPDENTGVIYHDENC